MRPRVEVNTPCATRASRTCTDSGKPRPAQLRSVTYVRAPDVPCDTRRSRRTPLTGLSSRCAWSIVGSTAAALDLGAVALVGEPAAPGPARGLGRSPRRG